jgi:hypothetical protein
MRTFLIAASLLALSTAGAVAYAEQLHATLANPANEESFIIDNVAWNCDGTSCVTTSSRKGGLGEFGQCRALVRKVGPVARFEDLDSGQLQQCNRATGD